MSTPANAATAPLRHSDETIISKLTIKGMGCDPKKVVNEDSGRYNLARIFGSVSDVKVTESKTIAGNLEVAFIGNFEGVNMQNGEVFRSGKLYLPKGISELMEQAFKKLKSEDDNASVSFAFEIRSVKATNPIGYSYEAQAIQSAQKVDELAELRARVMALPAVGATAPEKAPEKKLTSGSKR